MNRIDRGIKAATDAARLSTMNHRVGAAIYLGNRLISLGWNSNKTHPSVDTNLKWHHAETAALVGLSRIDLARAIIYVTRIRKDGSKSIAKPCESCEGNLRNVGIRKIFYTDREGYPQKMMLERQ